MKKPGVLLFFQDSILVHYGSSPHPPKNSVRLPLHFLTSLKPIYTPVGCELLWANTKPSNQHPCLLPPPPQWYTPFYFSSWRPSWPYGLWIPDCKGMTWFSCPCYVSTGNTLKYFVQQNNCVLNSMQQTKILLYGLQKKHLLDLSPCPSPPVMTNSVSTQLSQCPPIVFDFM